MTITGIAVWPTERQDVFAVDVDVPPASAWASHRVIETVPAPNPPLLADDATKEER